MLKKKIVTIVFCFIYYSIDAQSTIDQIKQDLQSFDYYLNVDSDSAFIIIDKAYKNSLQLKDKNLLSNTLYNYARYYHLISDFKQSNQLLEKAKKYAIESNNQQVLSSIYNLRGIIFYANGANNNALKEYLRAIKIAEKYKLTKIQSKTLLNLGGLYLSKKDTINYLNCIEKSIEIAKNNNYNQLLSKGYVNYALFYNNSNSEKAKKYYLLALTSAIQENNIHLQTQIQINLSELNLLKNNYENAIYHINQSQKLQNKTLDLSHLFYIYYNYGSYYNEINNKHEALNYLNKALKISSKNNIPPDRILSIYQILATINEDLGMYKEALEFSKKQFKLSDSLFSLRKNEQFDEIQTKYEVEKKNLKIQLLSKEKSIEKTRKIILIYIGIFLVLILIALYLYFKNRIKIQKLLQEKEKEKLTNEMENKLILAIIEAQDIERNKLATEIHDGVGGDLAGIKFKIVQINSLSENENLKTINQKISDVIQNLRKISHNLSSNFVKDKSLDKLLSVLIQEYNERKEFEIKMIKFPTNCLNNLPEKINFQLYRVFQELLYNVSKHSKAKNVSINITKHDDSLNIIFEDDGCGFSKKTKGIGLKNIQERVLSINGELIIESQINKGSTFIINFKI